MNCLQLSGRSITVSGVFKNTKRIYSTVRGGLLRYEEEQRRDRGRKVSEEVTHYHLLTCSVGDIVLTSYCFFFLAAVCEWLGLYKITLFRCVFPYTIGAQQSLFVSYRYIGNQQCISTEDLLYYYREQTV